MTRTILVALLACGILSGCLADPGASTSSPPPFPQVPPDVSFPPLPPDMAFARTYHLLIRGEPATLAYTIPEPRSLALGLGNVSLAQEFLLYANETMVRDMVVDSMGPLGWLVVDDERSQGVVFLGTDRTTWEFVQLAFVNDLPDSRLPSGFESGSKGNQTYERHGVNVDVKRGSSSWFVHYACQDPQLACPGEILVVPVVTKPFHGVGSGAQAPARGGRAENLPNLDPGYLAHSLPEVVASAQTQSAEVNQFMADDVEVLRATFTGFPIKGEEDWRVTLGNPSEGTALTFSWTAEYPGGDLVARTTVTARDDRVIVLPHTVRIPTSAEIQGQAHQCLSAGLGDAEIVGFAYDRGLWSNKTSVPLDDDHLDVTFRGIGPQCSQTQRVVGWGLDQLDVLYILEGTSGLG